MPTMKVEVMRPFPCWNLIISAEQTIELEEWIAKALIERGVCEDKAVYEARREEAARKKAEKKAMNLGEPLKEKRKKAA